VNITSTMEPLSARIPTDLYLWLAQLHVDGATTNSDKLRVLLAELKRQHEGTQDFVAAHAWARNLTARLRDALVRIENESGKHSEVLNSLLEYTTASVALTMSSMPTDVKDAASLEDTLVRRAFSLAESLLRQATTDSAAAFDPQVVKRHMHGTIDLAATIANRKGA
jgi:hypothetical protein